MLPVRLGYEGSIGSGSISSISISSAFELTSIRGTLAELLFSVIEACVSILGIGSIPRMEMGIPLRDGEVAGLLELIGLVRNDGFGDIPDVRSLFVTAFDIRSVFCFGLLVRIAEFERSLFAVKLLKSIVLKPPRCVGVLLVKRDWPRGMEVAFLFLS